MITVTQQQLINIVGVPKTALVQRLIGPINECLQKYQIDSLLRVHHFLAQVLHESGCFQYFEELASGKIYEGRKDLGNVNPGDGVTYKGRGLIQVTGRANYAQISKDLGVDFVANPKLLANDEYGVLSSGWYWNSRQLNQFADKDDIKTITRRINGGFNGLDQRIHWYNLAKQFITA
jgi:putative chitinase